MSIGAISASNPVTINGLRSAQSQPKAQADQATASTSVASNVAAASKEANETAAQTAQEAGHGDHQAQLLMQKHQHKHLHSGAATPPKAPATGVVNGNGQITGELINTKA